MVYPLFFTQSPSSSTVDKQASQPSSYTFDEQELQYDEFRPRWPSTFALESLEKLSMYYNTKTKTWSGSGLTSRSHPVVVCIGSGTGADVEEFLKNECTVYAVEPNAVFRTIASHRFAKYKDQFISINGDAIALNLPKGLVVDLIVCAQSLHTFSSQILGIKNAEESARSAWQTILPKKDKEARIAIWYYNLDPKIPSIIALDELLKSISVSYQKSQTTLRNAPLFEPRVFQHYIEAPSMRVSKEALPVTTLTLSKPQFMDWLSSYSFFPKAEKEQIEVLRSVSTWFNHHKNEKGMIELPYIGFISQGPLRKSAFVECPQLTKSLPISPISLKGSQEKKAEFLLEDKNTCLRSRL